MIGFTKARHVWNENAPVAVGRPEKISMLTRCRLTEKNSDLVEETGWFVSEKIRIKKIKNPWHKVVFDAAPKSFENDWKS